MFEINKLESCQAYHPDHDDCPFCHPPRENVCKVCGEEFVPEFGEEICGVCSLVAGHEIKLDDDL